MYKSFAGNVLFGPVNFQIEEGAHVGLTGVNGCGKTTLLRILGGEMAADSGQAVFSRGLKLAYMEQMLSAAPDATLLAAVESIFEPLFVMERRLQELTCLLEQRAADALISEQQRLQEEYQQQGGYTCRSRARSTLLGLGFSPAELDLPVAALSGGQRSKALLARMLLADANLLLLDEPTNHLDIAATEWLESFLSAYRGGFILISHDRYFLDKVTTETWEFAYQRLICHKGNYSAHKQKRAAEEESICRTYENSLREISRIEAIIAQQKRFNQARNYITIASKEKQIARIKAELIPPEQDDASLHFRFAPPTPGGNEVLQLHQVSKTFPGKRLFSGVDLEINKGERVFLLGANGCGKTTLLKIILGLLPHDAGMVKLGISINVGYYDQIQAPLNGGGTILQLFTDTFPQLSQTQIRTALGSFLFPGEGVQKMVSQLSGGERARLELLKLMLKPVNFLLLDEPSNHLDIRSREAVENALLHYDGTMLVVSHDRYLINCLATKIYYMDAEGLTLYPGNYDYYLEKKLLGAGQAVQSGGNAAQVEISDNKQEYLRRKEEQSRRRRLESAATRWEEDIATQEAALRGLQLQISDPNLAWNYQRLAQLSEQISVLEQQLAEAYRQWEDIAGQLTEDQ
ncbi:MAG: ABC-F family ATP-binding cassette domain-containing protein [Clostridiales bacterium]